MVRENIRRTKSAAKTRMAVDRSWKKYAHRRADRIRKNSFGVSLVHQSSGGRKYKRPQTKRPADNSDIKNGIRVLYISPLKALNNDIHRNLEVPLQGIHDEAVAQSIRLVKLRSAVRTGDTTQAERAAILRNPPDILITTPESLYLMLSSQKARMIFASVRYVIIDEIHSISGNKRGVHLSLSLERLEQAAARVIRAHRLVGNAAARWRRSPGSSADRNGATGN